MPTPRQPSRGARWSAACAEAVAALETLLELQEEYQSWYDNLPENLQSSVVGGKLEEITSLDLDGALSTVQEAEGTDLPLGFGRD
jgi:hypothetical protein